MNLIQPTNGRVSPAISSEISRGTERTRPDSAAFLPEFIAARNKTNGKEKNNLFTRDSPFNEFNLIFSRRRRGGTPAGKRTRRIVNERTDSTPCPSPLLDETTVKIIIVPVSPCADCLPPSRKCRKSTVDLAELGIGDLRLSAQSRVSRIPRSVRGMRSPRWNVEFLKCFFRQLVPLRGALRGTRRA